jgi:hypothetical protein
MFVVSSSFFFWILQCDPTPVTVDWNFANNVVAALVYGLIVIVLESMIHKIADKLWPQKGQEP